MGDDDLAGALRAAAGGDERGFAALWRALQPALLRYLRVLAGAAAGDVAAQTWRQVARELPGFAGDAMAFRVWLFRTARQRGIDERRRTGGRRDRPRESPRQDGATARARDTAVGALDESDTGRALRLISSLPLDQAEAVLLRVVAGLDVAATAQVMGRRAGAVRVATMRGLRRLAADPRVRQRGDRAQ